MVYGEKMIYKNNQPKDEEFSTNAWWIWNCVEQREAWWMFRKMFMVQSCSIKSAKVLVTSCFYHVVYINGEMISRGTARSFAFDKVFDVIDLTAYLIPGCENVLAILSPEMKEKDVTWDTNPKNSGLIAEIVIEYGNGQKTTIPTDNSWKVKRHPAFKLGMPYYAIPLGPEECYDANLEPLGWTMPEFDDWGWENAVEQVKVGMYPWTRMRKNKVGLLTNDPLFPQKVSAIELAKPLSGYRFRFAPSNPGIYAFVTEISCVEPVSVKFHFKNGWPQLSLNKTEIYNDEEIKLICGRNLVCCSQYVYEWNDFELLIETDAELTFSCDGILDANKSEWAALYIPTRTISYSWNESAPDVKEVTEEIHRISGAMSAQDIPEDIRKRFNAIENKESSICVYISSQRFFKVQGGYTHPAIEQGQPRFQAEDSLCTPIVDPQNMLHDNAGFSVVMPQRGMDVHLIVDFGRETIGYVELSMDAPQGAIVDVSCFEIIDGSGIKWMNNNAFRYICSEGSQRFVSFYRRGFRYASITLRNFQRPVKFNKICCYQSIYPVNEVGGFTCNDELLNRIYRMSLDTSSLCMLDAYVDCPGHEQKIWVGDARITALVNLMNFGAYEFDQGFLRIVGKSLSKDWEDTFGPKSGSHISEPSLPFSSYPRFPEGGVPLWPFQWVIHCWEHYLYGGSLEDLTENYGYVVEMMRRCRALTNERGLFDVYGAWNLIEWANNDLSSYGEVSASNIFLVECARCAARMARALGFKGQALAYEEEVENRKQVINRYCWDADRNAYMDTVRDEWAYSRYVKYAYNKGTVPDSYDRYLSLSRVSEQTNTLALLFDCVPQQKMEWVQQLVERVKSGHYVPGTPANRSYGYPPEKEAPNGIVAIGSPFFLFFSLGALYKTGSRDGTLNLIRRDWGKMAQKGTNTCWETFQYSEDQWTRSVCHGWSASPAIYLVTEVLGIRPLEAGYRKFSIKPYAGDLSWAKGSVATPYGPIYVEWYLTETAKFAITWSGPAECELVD